MRDELEDGRARDELERPREDLLVERFALPVERLAPVEPFRVAVRRRDERRRLPPLRSAAGISARATALVSCGIKRSRKPCMRSSSRLIARASWAVSRSPTIWASVSIAA